MTPSQGDHILTAIAIDSDKNSQAAIKWAADHILTSNNKCILVHVKTSDNQSSDNINPNIHKISLAPNADDGTRRLFLPYRAFCARKEIIAKEVLLHDLNVANALIEFIKANTICNIVVGASNRSTFRNSRSATWGNWRSITSQRSNNSLQASTNQRPINGRMKSPPMPSMRNFAVSHRYQYSSQSDDSISSGPYSSQSSDSGQTSSYYKEFPIFNKISSPATSMVNFNISHKHGYKDSSSSSDVSFTGPLSFRSSGASSSDGLKSTERMELEAQVRRLKLELKQREKVHAAVTAQQRLPQAAMSDVQAGERTDSNSTLTVQRNERDTIGEGPLNGFRHYKIEDIEEATDYFSTSMKIGEGGFGPVYKAFFDQIPVAIKVLRPDAAEGRKQFEQEVDILGCMRHPHMVLLLGTCPEYGCLVYEYMDNGSLEDRLFRKDNTPPIPWQARFKIAAEIATALLFLHRASPEPLVHRDLKPANILLDRNYVSKISDVGLARLVPPEVAENAMHPHMTVTAGTLFYIDPEYQQTGILSVKSDVYSLGILLLQIVTAMHPTGLIVKVERAIKEGTFEEILDRSVADWNVEGALSLAKMALKCCELRKKDRPDLESVVLPELERVRDL